MAEVGGNKYVRGILVENRPAGPVPSDVIHATGKGKSLLYGVEVVPRVVSDLVSDTGQGEQCTGHSRVAAGDEELVNLWRAAVRLQEGFVVPGRASGGGWRDVIRAVGRGKGRAGVGGQVLL